MHRMWRPATLAIALLAIGLAGCADDGPQQTDGDVVDVTDETGGIRGVVVDTAITPIVGATVTIAETDQSAETDENGAFTFGRLEPGTYILHAQAPLYDRQQTSVEVAAGVADPKPVKMQLTRLVASDPYYQVLPFKGYISCSLNAVVVLSEECGEGVGTPCEDPVLGEPVPVVGCQRVGGNPDNTAQIDFFVDNMDVKGFVIEQVWDPSISVGAGAQSGDFYTIFALDWACEPVCGGDRLAEEVSGSPLYIQVSDTDDATPIGSRAENGAFDEEAPFSTFTWASPDETGILLEQRFELFVTVSYHLPMPEGWSFVEDSPSPF